MTNGEASRANRKVRVGARSCPSNHATRRSILIVAAMATLCKCVLSKPRYRVRHIPNALTLARSCLLCPLGDRIDVCPLYLHTRLVRLEKPHVEPGGEAEASVGMVAWPGYIGPDLHMASPVTIPQYSLILLPSMVGVVVSSMAIIISKN